MRPHRRQPSRLPCPWDPPGKNTGVGCHFLLQCMKVKSESEVAQSCPTLSDPMDCSPPGSSSMGFSRREYWSGVLLALQIHEATSSFGSLPTPPLSPGITGTISLTLRNRHRLPVCMGLRPLHFFSLLCVLLPYPARVSGNVSSATREEGVEVCN